MSAKAEKTQFIKDLNQNVPVIITQIHYIKY